MSEMSVANQDPGHRPATTDQLLAAVVHSDNPMIENDLRGAAELSLNLASMVMPRLPSPGSDEFDQRRRAQGYSPRLQKVIGSVRGWEHDTSEAPSPLDTERKIVELDSILGALAGQPVAVMKPGRTWLDVGLLEEPQDQRANTGLQVFDALPDTPRSVQVSVHNAVTIDLRTGRAPEWTDQQDDEELSLRNLRKEDDPELRPSRPDINPLYTHVILGPKDAEDIAVTPATAYILAGYPLVQQTLNPILGFDPGRLRDSVAAEKYDTAVQARQQLKQAGVRLDFDFIDGYLAHRTAVFEREVAESGPFRELSGPYQRLLLAQMRQKYTTLVELGWIAPVTPVQNS
jgi:hypothetical protein